jgi:hypothetical protein
MGISLDTSKNKGIGCKKNSFPCFYAMLPLSPFDLHKQPLLDILQSVKSGKIQLADFQRDWCWEDQRIRSLLCEVSLGFPVGTLMLLEQNQNNAAWHLILNPFN